MVKTGGKKTLFYAFLLVFLIVGVNLSASGNQEDPVEVARSLIVEKRYNEALLMLADVARRDPERMDEAEKLIRQIRNIRGGYNEKYEELIKVLYEDKDVARALKIIEELETLDTNPNPSTRTAILRAKDSALFVYNRDRFNEIMDRAARLLERKEYWEAVTLYLSGFDIGKETFDKSGYGNIIENGTGAALASLREASNSFLRDRDGQLRAMEILKAAEASEDPAAIDAAAARYRESFRSAAGVFKSAVQTFEDLQEQNRRVVKIREGINEDYYLGFTQRFAAGRQTAVSPEGIKGAAELLIKDATAAFAAAMREKAAARLLTGRSLLSAEDRSGAAREFAASRRFAESADRAVGIWLEAVPENRGMPSPVLWKAVESEAGLFLGIKTVLRGAASYAALTNLLEDVRSWNDPPKSAAPDLRELRGKLEAGSESANRLREDWTLFGLSIGENPFSDEPARGIVARVTEDLAVWRDKILELEIDTVDRLAGLELAPLNDSLAERLEEFRRAEALVRGVEQEVDLGGGASEKAVFKYPAESLAILERLPARLNELQKATGDFVEVYGKEPPPIADYPGLRSKIQNGQANLTRIQGMKNAIPAVSARAREGVLLSERYRNEGNRKVAEAESAIARNNFDTAGESIRAARQSFTASLSYQENPAFRRDGDARLRALDEAIVKALNDLIIVEVRRLLNEGKRLYDVKSFNDAEKVLVRAQSRWRTTHLEDEPEVRRWLGYVRNALSVKANRQILETDPLFPEINQLLNLARQDYARGRDLIQRGARREALDYLAKAEEKIKQVVFTFPFNQDASVLTLRIAQLKDRDAFAVQFRTRFKEANDKMRTKPEEGYSELLDLEQIDPNFPGLQSAIFEAEIALRIRVRPPSRQDVNESETLYGRAASIVAGNVRAQFSIALEQLDRAIELNPNNQKAVELKDRVQMAVGGQTSVVLSSVAEEQYRQAERQFIAGNFFEALAIVQRLLQNKESKSYPPLLELKRRIESRI